tara:strand:+ start:1132 stop:1572 length:441 start_codon:yes stop_codon:yes gene_type:complete
MKEIVKTHVGDFVLYNYTKIGGKLPLRAAITYRIGPEHFESAGPVHLSINTPYGVQPFIDNHRINRKDMRFEWVMVSHTVKPRKEHNHPDWALAFAQKARDKGNIPMFVIERLLGVDANTIIKGGASQHERIFQGESGESVEVKAS